MSIKLGYRASFTLKPAAPYNFDANFHKPSHFPSSDNVWEKGKYWITMLWNGQELGLKFKNKGTVSRPKIRLSVFSRKPLKKKFVDNLVPEIRWRFNLDVGISSFGTAYGKDKAIGPLIKKWRGMKPIAANSLYETIVIYIVLQNATVRRSVHMLEKLFAKFGKKVAYDGKTMTTFWEPKKMARATERELRELKVGYRAKFLVKLTKQFAAKEIDEFALRKMKKEEVKKQMLDLYGIGPASVEYLLFEDFYFYDALETIPPWEQKILSRLIFNKKMVSDKKILGFFTKFKGWEKMAFHYIWEDVFWKRKHEHIDWLEKEIRL